MRSLVVEFVRMVGRHKHQMLEILAQNYYQESLQLKQNTIKKRFDVSYRHTFVPIKALISKWYSNTFI
jgi:hypothetical protein